MHMSAEMCRSTESLFQGGGVGGDDGVGERDSKRWRKKFKELRGRGDG